MKGNCKRILVFLMVLATMLNLCVTATATGIAREEAVQWAYSKINASLDYDGQNGYQCVDLIFYYYSYLGVGSRGGNACDYIYNPLPYGWQRISVTSGFVPQPGDIAVWKTNYSSICDIGTYSTGANGHVGIIEVADTEGFYVINQNFNHQPYCSRNWFRMDGLACVIRPDFKATVKESETFTCDYRITIPANYKLICYVSATAQTPSDRFISAKDSSYRLKCDQKVILSNGSVRYRFTSGDGYVLYFVYDSSIMSITVNHSYYIHSSTKPTCTNEGFEVSKCSKCGETKTETLAKTSHTPGEWTKTVEPTYIQKGTEVQSCKVCGVQLDKRSIPMLTYVNTFTDVKDGAWYSDEVEYVAKRGYMNGMSETKFSPNTNITREQFIMILANYAKANLPNYVGKTGFSDVPEGRWYSNAIQWARKKGYTDGVGNGKFGLGQEVTREQIAKFLYNYAEVKGRDVSGRADITGYTDDTRVSSWALQAVKWAVYNGIITSTKNDSYVIAPRETTTRAQAARMFMIFNETK